MSHLSPTTLGIQSLHFIPTNLSLQEQTPLSFPHSKVVEPLGLHTHSEIEKQDRFFKKQLLRHTLTQRIIEISWFAFITVVTSDVGFAFITFAACESLFALITFTTFKSVFANTIAILITIQN